MSCIVQRHLYFKSRLLVAICVRNCSGQLDTGVVLFIKFSIVLRFDKQISGKMLKIAKNVAYDTSLLSGLLKLSGCQKPFGILLLILLPEM